VLLLSVAWRLGRVGVVGEVVELCRACWGCAMCLGGDTIGDFDRWRDASRDRLLERPRTRALMAPKKSEAARDVGDVGDVGDTRGDIWSDDCEFCEPTVFVRMGCMGSKWDWDAMSGNCCDMLMHSDTRAESLITEASIQAQSGIEGDGWFKYSLMGDSCRTQTDAAQITSIYTQNHQRHTLSTGNMSFRMPQLAQLGAYRAEVQCVGDSLHQTAHAANHTIRWARGAAVP
jgi:hypothetical protein